MPTGRTVNILIPEPYSWESNTLTTRLSWPTSWCAELSSCRLCRNICSRCEMAVWCPLYTLVMSLMSSAMDVWLAKELRAACMWGSWDTNCFISPTVFALCRSWNVGDYVVSWAAKNMVSTWDPQTIKTWRQDRHGPAIQLKMSSSDTFICVVSHVERVLGGLLSCNTHWTSYPGQHGSAGLGNRWWYITVAACKLHLQQNILPD